MESRVKNCLECDKYAGDSKSPLIPKGFKHLKGNWNNGFTIESQNDGSQFVWIPIGALEADGTHDGKTLTEKFGRRNFYNEDFSETGYHEEINYEILNSVQKYGGVYISAFLASKENDKLVFKKGNDPIVNIDLYNSVEMAMKYVEQRTDCGSCLPNGSVYDSLFKWIIQMEGKTHDEVIKDSTSWGLYFNTTRIPFSPSFVMLGSSEECCVFNIHDLAGNCDEWSMEMDGMDDKLSFVLRGGYYLHDGDKHPVAYRDANYPDATTDGTSFRCVIYLK